MKNKAYRVFNKETLCVEVSIHVTFDESETKKDDKNSITKVPEIVESGVIKRNSEIVEQAPEVVEIEIVEQQIVESDNTPAAEQEINL